MISIRELRANIFLGPDIEGPRVNYLELFIQRKNNRYLMTCLSINGSKMISFRLVEKRRIKVLDVDFSPTVFRFKAKMIAGVDIPTAP